MRHYKAGSIDHWTRYENEDIVFDNNHVHSVHLKVISDKPFTVMASDDENKNVLVGVGNDEVIQISLTIVRPTTIKIKSNGNTHVWIPESAAGATRVYPDENFVSLEPKVTKSPEIYRIEQMMLENQRRMMQMLQAERNARLEAESHVYSSSRQKEEEILPSQEPVPEGLSQTDSDDESK
jgi:hypothetical protein